MTRWLRPAAWAGALLAGWVTVTAVAVALREPALDRAWDEDVSVLTRVTVDNDGRLRLERVRRWTYATDSVLSKEYGPVSYYVDDVTGLWLYEQELGLGGRIAHTFLVFEFPEAYGDDRWLGISVETRREIGESYSIVGGMMRRFELTHVWAREEDLVRRRVQYLDYPLTRYRVDVAPEHVARIFRQLADETAALGERPRWYHTLTTNCTSSLIEYVNRVQPDAIPWHFSSILTGRADDYLARLGYLEPGSAEPITRTRLAQGPLR